MGLLGAGAGAAEGLDTVLARMIQKAKFDQETAALHENMRKNRAEEDFRTKQLGEMTRMRDSEDAAKAADLKSKEAERLSKETDRRLGMMNINDLVPDDLVSDATKTGVPQSLFNFSPDNLVEMNPHESARWRGTFDQNLKLQQEANKEKQQPVSTQVHTRVITDPSLAKDLGVAVNSPVDAAFDPKAQTFSYRGKDITAGSGHYEKPATPDRVLIQSGDSYMPRSEALRTLGQGGDVPLATTSATRQMQEGAKMLLPEVGHLSSLAEELDKRGMFGPLASRLRGYLTKYGTMLDSNDRDTQQRGLMAMGDEIRSDPSLNSDELAGEFASSLGLLATGAGRVHGGSRGGGSPMMLEHFKDLLGSNGTLSMFKGRLKGLTNYLNGYAAGPPSDKKGVQSGGKDPFDLLYDSLYGTKKD